MTLSGEVVAFALGILFGLLASLPAVALVRATGRHQDRAPTWESTTWAARTVYVLDADGEVVDGEVAILQPIRRLSERTYHDRGHQYPEGVTDSP